MSESLLGSLTLVIGLGLAAQWLAWRARAPSILLLLLFGFLAGPVAGWIRPDALLGKWLMPLVSVSVALILFEGGLTLRFAELRTIGSVVRNLISIGATVTWIVTSAAAYFFFDWNVSLAALLGAILVVTGPTVIMPLLRQIQPSKSVGSILKWEGILIDPIGALLALIVFEAILAKELQSVAGSAVLSFAKTLVVGAGLGWAGAQALLLFLRRHWLPDFLQNPVSLLGVIALFTVSNALQHESGLLTVTVFGIALANQRRVAIRHIVEFKENLRVLLLSGLFVLLAARVDLEELKGMSWASSMGFLLTLIFVARPLAVLISSGGAGLSWKERFLLSAMAPRGIVAAAVASIFALRLSEEGYANATEIVPATFIVIVGTVMIYGLSAPILARRLGISNPNPQGALIVGAHALARTLGKALQSEGYGVLLVDTNRDNLATARMEGLPTYYGSIVSERARDELDLAGLGKLIAVTPNAEVNALACLHFLEFFGRSEIYHLAPSEDEAGRIDSMAQELRGRTLFGEGVTFAALDHMLARGGTVKKTRLTEEWDFEAYQERWGGNAVPLFLVGATGALRVFTPRDRLKPEPGQTLISLTLPEAPTPAEESRRASGES